MCLWQWSAFIIVRDGRSGQCKPHGQGLVVFIPVVPAHKADVDATKELADE